MNQQTLKTSYKFEGRGLHTGKFAHLILMPAPADYGIRFVRTDLGVEVPALASKVTRTDRSTTIAEGEVSVITIEHLMSALTGLGVDNARIELDNEEVPILDGSAERYVRAIAPDGLQEQEAERRWVELTETVEVVDEETGSRIRIEPAENHALPVVTLLDAVVEFGIDVEGEEEIEQELVRFVLREDAGVEVVPQIGHHPLVETPDRVVIIPLGPEREVHDAEEL